MRVLQCHKVKDAKLRDCVASIDFELNEHIRIYALRLIRQPDGSFYIYAPTAGTRRTATAEREPARRMMPLTEFDAVKDEGRPVRVIGVVDEEDMIKSIVIIEDADGDGEFYPIVEDSDFKRPVVPVAGISPAAAVNDNAQEGPYTSLPPPAAAGTGRPHQHQR
jgi:hypothetical protein